MKSLISSNWKVYLRASEREIPSLSTLDIINQLREAKLSRSDLVWTEGQKDWIEIGALEKLLLAEIRNSRSGIVSASTPQVQLPKLVRDDAKAGTARTTQQYDEKENRNVAPAPSFQSANLHSASSQATSLKKVADTLQAENKETLAPVTSHHNAGLADHEKLDMTGASQAQTEGGAINSPIEDKTVTDAKDLKQSNIDGVESSQPRGDVSELPEGADVDLGVFSKEENGIIKNYDFTNRSGKIFVEGKGNLHFFRSALPNNAPRELVGSKVLAQVIKTNQRVMASSIKILSSPVVDLDHTQSIKNYQLEIHQLATKKIRDEWPRPGDLLTKWSNLAVDPTSIEIKGAKQILDAMPKLAELCLQEHWCFDYDKDRDKYAILRKYIKYTFYRIFREGKIAFSKTHATFNTGLVDQLFEPIFALFQRNTRLGSTPYRFLDFCVVGNEGSGKELMERFALPDRPEPAQYMKSFDEVIFDSRCHVNIQFKHVIDDAIVRGRYPLEFLLKHMPPSMRDEAEPSVKNKTWLNKYVEALNGSPQRKRSFASDLRYATEFAQKRARWNYKTAIPNYFPTLNQMSLLLPLALLDDSKPDMAMVANRVNEHEYYGVTVYPLDMAYESARLVCRPDSDWLTPQITKASEVEEDDPDEQGEEGQSPEK